MLSVIASSGMACWRGGNVCNEMRQILLTRLAKMNFVTRPHRAAFLAKVGHGTRKGS